jgi:ABC-type transporter Mla subunit MlaD
MCLNCGCGQPEDDKGDSRNITLSTLKAASDATGQSLHETIDHMERALDAVEAQKLGVGTQTQGSAGQV